MRPAAILLSILLIAGMPALAQPPACPARGEGPLAAYRNDRFGYGFDVPPNFAMDPSSVPPGGDGARFWTADRRATAVVNAQPNPRGLSVQDLLADAEGDVVANSGGTITYRRVQDSWFVLSGTMAGRIFYRRTMLTRAGTIATLWMEFPRDMRPCLDGAVTTMSLSFRGR